MAEVAATLALFEQSDDGPITMTAQTLVQAVSYAT